VTRVVIDASVFVSALIGKPGSAPDIVVRAFIDDKIEVVATATDRGARAGARATEIPALHRPEERN
jgi:hypothetical protein